MRVHPLFSIIAFIGFCGQRTGQSSKLLIYKNPDNGIEDQLVVLLARMMHKDGITLK
jgi:hypothetical protein